MYGKISKVMLTPVRLEVPHLISSPEIKLEVAKDVAIVM